MLNIATVSETDPNHVGRRVRVMDTFGEVTQGLLGICTADLPHYDAYAVEFDQPLKYARWVRFEHAAKRHFGILDA